MPARPRLPIDEVLAPLRAHLRRPGANAVVLAPPGAGKTTGLPLALLASEYEGELAGAETPHIWVAQPRRLAARMAARLCARFVGEPLGQRIGYQVRYDRQSSEATRLCYLTDGLLLRKLRADPKLRDVDIVILDEFHERKLDGDLTLALLLRAQRSVRPDLRIIVMSATLDPGPIAAYLDAETFTSQGRAFDVEHRFAPLRDRPLESGVLRALGERVDAAQRVDVEHLGHVLVFLPGAAEIRRCEKALRGYCEHHDLRLFTLHGDLDRDRQELAVGPSERPKVILSTNVAETSVTIDDVATVIDSGLARVARHDPWTGLSALELRPISRASATQRAGRAGRTRPGLCVHLYAKADLDRRPARDAAEVARAELSEALFELASAGVQDFESFAWFEAPPAAAVDRARELLVGLQAIDEAGVLTPLGQRMRPWPLHPRLARVMVDAAARGCGDLAAWVCAVLAERPLRRSDRPAPRPDDADPLFELNEMGAFASRREAPERGHLDPKGVEAVRRAAKALRGSLRRAKNSGGTRELGPKRARVEIRKVLLEAFFDKVAKVRERDGRLEAVGVDGRAIPLAPSCVVREDPWIVALQARERSEGTRRRREVTAACAVQRDWILESRLEEVQDKREVEFDAERERVVAVETLKLGALELERSVVDGNPEAMGAALFEAAKATGVERFVDTAALEQLRARVAFAREAGFEMPELDDARLLAVLEHACVGRRSFAELRQAKLVDALRAELGADAARLDRIAPARVKLKSGRSLVVTYAPGQSPSVASFLQDFFGETRGPSLAEGRVPLVLHLRAPNRRDVQVTTDLAGFWERHYPTLRKQLMRRYPKHAWPEDPVSATPPAPRPRRPRRR